MRARPPKIVGGSTITQQLAKNLLLSGERNLLRKGQEFVLTMALEHTLSKQRILEIYLNNVEWGEGVFGAEAAAQHYFRKPASRLTPYEAARLAVMLPQPKRFEENARLALPGRAHRDHRGAHVRGGTAVMRILGIDPGLQRTGFGVIDAHGHTLQYVASGTISTMHMERGDLPARLKVLVRRHRRTALALPAGCGGGRDRVRQRQSAVDAAAGDRRAGACVTALVANALSVAEYTPMQMKLAVAGTGKAAKTQVQLMVQRLLQLPGLPGKDAADALGLAITHAHAAVATARIQEAGGVARRKTGYYKTGRVV
jgi:crossover junction endodeoxyribonuclease RuvC